MDSSSSTQLNGLPLPIELRYRIYDLAIGATSTQIHPYMPFQPKNPDRYYTGTKKSSHPNKSAKSKSVSKHRRWTITAALALTCRQFSDDMKTPFFLYHKRTVCLGCPYEALKYLNSIGQDRMNLIGSVELSIETHWLSASTNQFDGLFRALATFKTLKKLRIEIWGARQSVYGSLSHMSWLSYFTIKTKELKSIRGLESFDWPWPAYRLDLGGQHHVTREDWDRFVNDLRAKVTKPKKVES